MPNAGNAGDIMVSADDTTYSTVTGCNTIASPRSRDVVDVTDFDDEAKDKILTLFDSSFNLSGTWPGSADTGFGVLETGFDAGSYVFVRVRWDGTNGYKTRCLVENIDISSTPAGAVQFTVSLQGTQKPVAVP